MSWDNALRGQKVPLKEKKKAFQVPPAIHARGLGEAFRIGTGFKDTARAHKGTESGLEGIRQMRLEVLMTTKL